MSLNPAIKVINPFVCPYCGGTFKRIVKYNSTRTDCLNENGRIIRGICSNEFVEEKLVCVNCNHNFKVALVENPFGDNIYCIDIDRGNEIVKEKLSKIDIEEAYNEISY
jgi:protein-arginine kinase activator protein McsA